MSSSFFSTKDLQKDGRIHCFLKELLGRGSCPSLVDDDFQGAVPQFVVHSVPES